MFKHQPLGFHDRAKPAAIASMAAHKQGKFWEYHDKIFENQKQLADADFERYASEIGLDMARFKQDLKSPELSKTVDEHNAQCSRSGGGTPAFLVNGRKLSGAKPFSEFKTTIDEELVLAKKLVSQGVAKAKLYEEIVKKADKDADKPLAKPASAAPKKPDLDAAEYKFQLEGAPTQGNSSAVATLVIFSDFQ